MVEWLSANELRQVLDRALAHTVSFRAAVEDAPQVPSAGFLQALARFDAPTPERPSDPVAIIDELAELVDGGLMMPTGPRFFGWVIGGSHPVGVAADWLTSAWGQNAGNHQAAPAASAAEVVAGRWALDLLDLPRESAVGFTTGATMANFTCLAVARGAVLRAVGWDVDRQGLFGAPEVTVLIGEEAHSTVFAGLQYLGLGRDRVVRVATDQQGAILSEDFHRALEAVSGPTIAILQAGQINSGAFDPFEEIVPVARAAGAWVHVDGAFGLWARAAGSRFGLTAGVEQADSWATDGHKWPQAPYDCGLAIVRDELAIRRAMTIAASYLPEAAADERDPTHYVPELSRRARGFATWAVIRALGRSGIAELVERDCRVATLMADRLAAEPGVAVVNDVVLNQVLVRFGVDEAVERGDELTRMTIRRIQEDATCMASGTDWRGQHVMRLSVIGGTTHEVDGATSAEAIVSAWRTVRSGANGPLSG